MKKKKIVISLLVAAVLICTAVVVGIVLAGNGSNTYTVTFDADGGSFSDGTAVKTVKIKDDETLSSVEEPKKDLHKFLYWTLNGSKYQFGNKVASDLTLIATYEDLTDNPCTVSLTYGEGVTVSGIEDGGTYTYGTQVKFTVEVDAFYDGVPVITLNKETLEANDKGEYSFIVTGDSAVNISGIRPAVSSIGGSGTLEEPYLLSSPADLVFIAERINNADNAYVTACYELENDIDFKGHSMPVIGDANTDNSVFSGYFNGNGHSVKNFVIESHGVEYVGFFGLVVVDPSVSSSGTIYNLTLENYTVSGYSEGNMLAVGSFVGYGIGANVMLCTAKNGSIEIYADDDYPAYAGGIIGFQQSMYVAEYGVRYLSSVAYASANVEINCNSGYTLSAGGISGYVYTNESYTPSYVNNSYSNSIVTGALRTGGIVGFLGNYNSVTDCFSTGDVSAQTSFRDTINLSQYCYAYAGGIVGYAENETAVTFCFATGFVDAYAPLGENYQKTGDIVGGGAEADNAFLGSAKYVEYNNYYAEGGEDEQNNINFKDPQFILNNLHWNAHDWVLESGEYPVINYESVDVVINFNVNLNGHTFNGQPNAGIEIENLYLSLATCYLNGNFSEYILADDGYRSYGYYFDEALQVKIPASYVMTKNLNVYAGFADVSEIAGTYYIVSGGIADNAYIKLNADGTLEYSDGSAVSQASYVYDGDKLLILSARFSRFASDGEPAEALFAVSNYYATVSDKTLNIFNGTIYTENNPLTAVGNYGVSGSFYLSSDSSESYTFYKNFTGTYVDDKGLSSSFAYAVNENGSLIINRANSALNGSITGSVLNVEGKLYTAFDKYKGVWEKEAVFNKSYTFDGKGNFTYEYYRYASQSSNKSYIERLNGTYAMEANGDIVLSNGAIAYFDNNGNLIIEDGQNGPKAFYYPQYAYVGEWEDVAHGVTLTLGGMALNSRGAAMISYTGGSSYNLTYEVENGYVLLYSGSELLGYFNFNEANKVLNASIYSVADEAIIPGFSFIRKDAYRGEWISEDNLFEAVNFNGYGNYSASLGAIALEGYVLINGERVRYYLDDFTMSGNFTYDGATYTITIDEANGLVVINSVRGTVSLERKDEYSNQPLLDGDGNVYSFDGRGNLPSGGTLTVTSSGSSKTYNYKIENNNANVTENGQLVGQIVKGELTYSFVAGGASKELRLQTSHSGEWAVAGGNMLLVIGGADFKGVETGTYAGENITYNRYGDSEIYTFTFDNTLFYIYPIDDNTIAVSAYTSLIFGDYVLAVRKDEMFGEWVRKRDNRTFAFDGTSSSSYVNGTAVLTYKGLVGESSTEYVYVYSDGEYVVWNNYANYQLVWCDVSDKDAYVRGDRAFKMVKIDMLFGIVATDSDGVTYSFDGKGGVTTSDGKTYTYEIVTNNTSISTAYITLSDGENSFDATVNYEDSNNVIFALVEE